MARAATTTDVFNAVAEAHRREILDVLVRGESPVGGIVDAVGLTQPQVSKHLSVLRSVDLVRSRTAGRQRLYRVNGPALQPIRDWLESFAALWNERLDRLDAFLDELDPTHDQEDPRS